MENFDSLKLIDEIRTSRFDKKDIISNLTYKVLLDKQPLGTRIIIKNDRPIGYYSIIAFSNETFKQISEGQIHENQINFHRYIEEIKDKDNYNFKSLYILSIASMVNATNKDNINLLMQFRSDLNDLIYNNSIIEIGAKFTNIKILKLSDRYFRKLTIKNL